MTLRAIWFPSTQGCAAHSEETLGPLGDHAHSTPHLNTQVLQHASTSRTLVLIGVAAVLGAALLGADFLGAAVLGAVLTPRSAPSGCAGQASSQQHPPYPQAHPTVFDAVCPPQWLPMLLAYTVPSVPLLSPLPPQSLQTPPKPLH